ncbi:MAG: hypothetical protein HY666_02025 [Chloroflexi bacterium]|nr:hypothetical protein [Chloroflexota bacterium]
MALAEGFPVLEMPFTSTPQLTQKAASLFIIRPQLEQKISSEPLVGGGWVIFLPPE